MGLPAVGDTLLGKYKLLRIVGEGGMGVVFEAHHERIDRRVAIKMLRGEVSDNEEVVARFSREARAAAKLGSRHTAHIIDVEDVNGLPIMVMEFLDGHDLADELDKRGPLPVDEAVGYVLSACVAMAEAHAHGIVHRDLKPSNLFIARESGERVIKVLDFGISKMIDNGNVNVTATQGGTLGTPLYMSPEQVRSAKNVDARTDIWSLGIILYELLAGRPPFVGDGGSAVIAAIAADEPTPLREHREDVPEKLAAIVHRAIAKAPGDRFASVKAFATELMPFGPQTSSGRLAVLTPLPSDPIIPAERAPRPSNPELEMADTVVPQLASTKPATMVGTTNPVQTAGTWSTRTEGQRGRATKTLFAVIGGAIVVVAGVVAFTQRSSTPATATPSATLPSASTLPSPITSTTAETPPATVSAVVATPSASVEAPSPSPSSTMATTPATKASTARPTTRPTTTTTGTTKTTPPPTTPTANPNRL